MKLEEGLVSHCFSPIGLNVCKRLVSPSNAHVRQVGMSPESHHKHWLSIGSSTLIHQGFNTVSCFVTICYHIWIYLVHIFNKAIIDSSFVMISVTFHPLPVHLVSPPNKQIQLALAREVSQHLFGEKTWLSYWPSSEASKLRSESLVAPQLVVVPWQLVRVTAEW